MHSTHYITGMKVDDKRRREKSQICSKWLLQRIHIPGEQCLYAAAEESASSKEQRESSQGLFSLSLIEFDRPFNIAVKVSNRVLSQVPSGSKVKAV